MATLNVHGADWIHSKPHDSQVCAAPQSDWKLGPESGQQQFNNAHNVC